MTFLKGPSPVVIDWVRLTVSLPARSALRQLRVVDTSFMDSLDADSPTKFCNGPVFTQVRPYYKGDSK